ncbi:hypothetical protein KP509_1Z013400 [Ceratopteris richardii]|nr:hypothetical protein KP509_1Z013400 [Ceratopteris richardii]
MNKEISDIIKLASSSSSPKPIAKDIVLNTEVIVYIIFEAHRPQLRSHRHRVCPSRSTGVCPSWIGASATTKWLQSRSSGFSHDRVASFAIEWRLGSQVPRNAVSVHRG